MQSKRIVPASRAHRRLWIAPVLLLAIAALFLGGLRYYTSAGRIERKLSAAIASAQGVNRVRIGSSHYNPWRGTYAAGDIELHPDTLLLAEQRKAGTARRTQYSVTVSSLRVHGIDGWPFLFGNLVADSIVVDGARLDITRDRVTGPPRPNEPATLPHQLLQSAERGISAAAIKVANAEISYSERAQDGARFGTIRFTDVKAGAAGVTNDDATNPCRIDVHTRIAGAGQLDATFDYDLVASRLNMTCRGSVGRMDPQPLNDLLVNLEGLRITSGAVDSLWFDFAVKDDVARGKMQVLYRDIKLEKLDKVGLNRGVGDRLQTFIMDVSKLQHTNPPDDDKPALVAAIEYERPAETSLIKFLWVTLRAGILWTLGF